MKAAILSVSASALVVASALSQDSLSSSQLAPAQASGTPAASGPSQSQRFDLRFPGGTVKEFVAAVSEKLGRPVNVIIPKDSESAPIPPLEVYRVTVSSLFRAVSTREGNSRASFITQDKEDSPDAIWQFEGPGQDLAIAMREIRYFPIAEFLPRFTIEDITTAIETGWALQSVTPSATKPTLKYHEETKLLICAATSGQLDIIPQVLKGLTEVPFPRNDEILKKANNIIIPRLEFRDATVKESIDFIQKKSFLLDDPNYPNRGINIALDEVNGPAERKVSVSLSNVPLMDALKTIASLAGLEMEVRETVVLLKTPAPAGSNESVKPTAGIEVKVPISDTAASLLPGITPASAPQAAQ